MSAAERALRRVRQLLLLWCKWPVAAGAASGLLGGAASGTLTALLMPESLEALGAAVGAPPLGWVVHLLLSGVIGAAFGRFARPWLADARRAVACGAGCGLLWWLAGPALLASAWPGWSALHPLLGDGPAAAGLIDLGCHLTYGAVMAGALWGCQALLRDSGPGRGVLEVYIAGHCWTCEEAQRLASAAAARFPDLDVRLLDVDAGGAAADATPVPDRVVAVPTYLLDGAVVALGNPAPETLFARIRSSLLTRAPVPGARARQVPARR